MKNSTSGTGMEQWREVSKKWRLLGYAPSGQRQDLAGKADSPSHVFTNADLDSALKTNGHARTSKRNRAKSTPRKT